MNGVFRAGLLLITLIAGFACLTGAASARAPALVGAATHPLWSDSSVADFDRELDLLVEAGASTVRVDVNWSSLEQNGPGVRAEWYVQKADTFFAHARARGLRVIVTFWGTPCWASSAPEDVKQGCAGAWWDRGVERYPPADLARFAAAAAWVAERWGDDMAALEVWNEPNLQVFFRSPAPAADYSALLKAAYPQIKQADPDLPVLGPAMVMSDAPFLEELYGQGIKDHFDGVSLRPFNQGRDPRDPGVPGKYSFLLGVPWVREVMVAHGDADKKMWFTELGWSSCGPGGTSTWCVTPDVQARYVADALRMVRDRWDYVQSVSVYNLRNTGTDPNDRESQMGLLHRDFAPKPAFAAFREAIADLRAQPDPVTPPKAPGAEPRVDPPGAPSPPAPLPSRASPPPDRTAPVLSGLSLHARGPRGRRHTAVRWTQSEAARVTFRLERRTRRGRWLRLPGSVVHVGRRGRNGAPLTRVLQGMPRPSSRLRVVAVGRDRAGNASVPIRMELPRARRGPKRAG